MVFFMNNGGMAQDGLFEYSTCFDWQPLWSKFVETIKACLQLAKARGLRFPVENHTPTMIHDASGEQIASGL